VDRAISAFLRIGLDVRGMNSSFKVIATGGYETSFNNLFEKESSERNRRLHSIWISRVAFRHQFSIWPYTILDSWKG